MRMFQLPLLRDGGNEVVCLTRVSVIRVGRVGLSTLISLMDAQLL